MREGEAAGRLANTLQAIARTAASLQGGGSARISLFERSSAALRVVARFGTQPDAPVLHSARLRGRQGEDFGVLTIHSARPRSPSRLEVELAEICARWAADAVEAARAEEALGESDRRREEFVATLAHELRNPLAPIRNAVHLLALAPAGSPTAEDARRIIERQTSQLVRLLDDLLDVSRMSTGKLELRRKPVELASVVAAALETSRPLIEARRQVLRTRLAADRLTVEADPLRLAQAVSNLLNNAAKYTDENGLIELSVRREHSHGLISVRDNGIGIDPALLPRVFDLFAQLGSEHGEGGLGVGLTLARRLVLLHGGSIEARSAGPGTGSEFLVRLPLVSRTRATPFTATGRSASAPRPEASRDQVPRPHRPQ